MPMVFPIVFVCKMIYIYIFRGKKSASLSTSYKHVIKGKLSPLLLHLNKYNLVFYLTTLISKFPKEKTMTLVLKMLQEAPRNPSNCNTVEIKYKRKSTRKKKKTSLLLVT